jgi:hypothetical protein
VDASSWSLPDLLRLGLMGEPQALKKIESEPGCAWNKRDSQLRDLAVYFNASQAVMDAMDEARRRVWPMSDSDDE